MERLVCAAIKYRMLGETEFKYVKGKNHSQCIEVFYLSDLFAIKRDIDAEVQGFMTDTGRFVDRIEAKEIAIKAGQIPKDYSRSLLYSEFINWNS